MTVINEHVQNTTNNSVESSAANVNTPTKSSQPEERPAIASTAAGIPAPAHVVNALQETRTKQDENELPGTGSTATGMPNPAAVDAAVEDAEKGKESTSSSSSSGSDYENDNKENTDASKGSKRKGSKRQSLKKAVDTVAHAPATAAHKVIKKVAPSKSADTPSSDSTSSDQQRQSKASVGDNQEKGEHKDTSIGDKQDKDTSVTSNDAVQAAITSTAQNGAIDTTNCLPSSESEATTLTPLDRLSESQPTDSQSNKFESIGGSTGCQAVVPVAENLPVPFESAQEPVVEEAVIEKPQVAPTPTGVQAKDRAVSEVPAPANQVSVSQDSAGKLEQETSVGKEPFKTTPQSKLASNDVKTEQTRAAEEPVTKDDINSAVDQISVAVSDNDVKTKEPVQQNKTIGDGSSTSISNVSTGVKTQDKPSSFKTQDQPTDIKTQDQPTGIKTQDQPTGIKTQDQPTGIKAQDQPTGIKTQDQPTGIKAQDQPTGIKTQDQPTGIKTQDQPTGIKTQDHPTGIKAQDQPTDIKTEDKPTGIKSQDKPIDTTTQDKPSDAKATAPQEPSIQATPEPKSRGINSTQPATNSKELPPQPSSESDQSKGTGSKSPPCTIM